MANKPFDRLVLNTRERPLSSDINIAGSYGDQATRFMLRHLLARRTSISDPSAAHITGFVGEGFRPLESSPPALTVNIRPGLGFFSDPSDVPSDIDGVSQLNDLEQFKPLVLTGIETVTINAADPVNARIDIVEVKIDRRREDSTSRDVLNPATGVFEPDTVLKTLSFSHDGQTGNATTPATSTRGISVVAGLPSGSPVVPPTSSGYVKIAQIAVPALATTIINDNIIDFRPQLSLYGDIKITGVVTVDVAANTQVLNQLQAPPGWQVSVENGVDVGDNFFRIWVITPGQFYRFAGTASIGGGVSILFDPGYLKIGGDFLKSFTALTSGEASDLRGDAEFDPNIDVGTGSFYNIFFVDWELAAGADYDFNFTIHAIPA